MPNLSVEFRFLATAANFIRSEFPTENIAWKGSPFEWILNLPSASKGKLGKRLINQWCALKGLSVTNSPDSEADMIVNGHRVEVKFSTLWENGIYKFQQIRDQNYDYSVCLGISPYDAQCWVISKSILKSNVIGHMGQHTGRGGQETAWFTILPSNPPLWLNGCGGTLDQAYLVLKSLSRKR
jgi:hypothetical protein